MIALKLTDLENQFQNLVENCGYGTLSFNEIKKVYATCFNFNFPVSAS